MNATYQQRLGERLRGIRSQQGLTLHEVEEKSGGEWKAVVVGSYERGDRAVSVEKLARLAEFYGVPLSELLPTAGTTSTVEAPEVRLVLDLARLGELGVSAPYDVMRRYVTRVQRDRGDYNGRVITLRQADLRSIAAATDQEVEDLVQDLTALGAIH